jgi:RNA methyltransferase, TrmH family
MAVINLSGARNPVLKSARLVASRSRRAPEDLVLAEGLRVLEEATASGHTITAVILSEAFGATPRQQALLAAWSTGGVRIYRAGEKALRSISSVQEPQGAMALVRVPWATLADFTPGPGTSVLCACGLQDPGNLGTLIRTAAAAGCSLLCTTPSTASPRNPKALRASAGAFFRLRVVENVAAEEIFAFGRKHGLRVYRTDASLGQDYSRADLRAPFVLLLGNEAHGFAADGWDDLPSLRIPMADGVESLNVAAAGAIVLFEAIRQRHTPAAS